MNAYNPPTTLLVRTWFQILSSQEDPEALKHAKQIIERNFGSVELACLYLEQVEQKKTSQHFCSN